MKTKKKYHSVGIWEMFLFYTNWPFVKVSKWKWKTKILHCRNSSNVYRLFKYNIILWVLHPATFYRSVCTKTGKWVVMYLRVCFYWVWNYSDNVIFLFFIFILILSQMVSLYKTKHFSNPDRLVFFLVFILLHILFIVYIKYMTTHFPVLVQTLR
jgi:phosphatidylserine synthase